MYDKQVYVFECGTCFRRFRLASATAGVPAHRRFPLREDLCLGSGNQVKVLQVAYGQPFDAENAESVVRLAVPIK